MNYEYDMHIPESVSNTETKKKKLEGNTEGIDAWLLYTDLKIIIIMITSESIHICSIIIIVW